MTRWARGGNLNKKKEFGATPWSKLSGTGTNPRRGNVDKDRSDAPAQVQKLKTRNRFPAKDETDTAELASVKKVSKGKTKVSRRKKSGLLDALDSPKDTSVEQVEEVSDCSDSEKDPGVAAVLQNLQPDPQREDTSDGTFDGTNKKEERREKRRLKRIDQRQTDMVCYNCRKEGHDMSSCPRLQKDTSQGTGICFKCGSTEHSINRCHVKLPAGVFPYAKCFICKETGHLSKQCPDNPRGLYPNGGCCKWCSSVEHFKRDCPELKKKQGIDDLKLDKWNASVKRSADADDYLLEERPAKVLKLKKKVVMF